MTGGGEIVRNPRIARRQRIERMLNLIGAAVVVNLIATGILYAIVAVT